MELLQLRYFCLLAEKEHLTKTAQELYISAPSLSKSLKKLESELGVRLFDRIDNRIYLNHHGKIFYQKIKTALHDIDNAMEEIRRSKENEIPNIRIALYSPLIWEPFINHVSKYKKTFQLKIEKLDPINYRESARNIDFYLGATVDMDHIDVYSYEYLRKEEELLAVLSPQHKLSNRENLYLKDLENEMIITPHNSNKAMDRYIKKCFQLKGVRPAGYILSDYFSRYKFVLFNEGISITTTLGVKTYFLESEKLKIIPIIDSPLNRRQAVFWEKGNHLNDIELEFLDCIKRFYQTSI